LDAFALQRHRYPGAEPRYHEAGKLDGEVALRYAEDYVTSARSLAEIVRHYVKGHCSNRTLSNIATELKRRTGSGSHTALSAWANGHRRPASNK